jgi:hypothetical protein
MRICQIFGLAAAALLSEDVKSSWSRCTDQDWRPSSFFEANAQCPKLKAEILARSNGSGTIELMQHVLDMLENLPGPIYAHASAGGFRQGKSTGLTLMARFLLPEHLKQRCPVSFHIGDGSLGVTRGVHVWFMPRSVVHPDLPGTYVLFDMEGLGDPGTDVDARAIPGLFSLAALSSTSLMFHSSTKALSADDLNKLGVLAKLSSLIDVSGAESRELLPKLRVFVLNGQLYLREKGMQDGTYDLSYVFEKALASGHDAELNAAKQLVISLFPHRSMFAARPTELPTRDLDRLNSKSGIPKLTDPFIESFQVIATRMINDWTPKTYGMKELDGKSLRWLLEEIAKAANDPKHCSSGDCPLHVTALNGKFCEKVAEPTKEKIMSHCHFVESILPMSEKYIQDEFDKAMNTVRTELSKELAKHMSQGYITKCTKDVEESVSTCFKNVLTMNKLIGSYEWSVTPWGACQGACPGERHRDVMCKRGDGQLVSEMYCDQALAPRSRENCNIQGYTWLTSDWSACQGTCPGKKTRSVRCANCDGVQVSDSNCQGLSPPGTDTSCEAWSYDWITGDWHGCNAGNCKPGIEERSISCKRCDGAIIVSFFFEYFRMVKVIFRHLMDLGSVILGQDLHLLENAALDVNITTWIPVSLVTRW